MAKMIWDAVGEKVYETGVEQVALYRMVDGAYSTGVAWNGITALNLTPSGAEATSLYANNRKYLTLMSVEELGGTIEAYTYPDEWAECDGSAMVAPGIYVGQQARKPFGLAAKTLLGNDTELTAYGYKLHLVYGGLASPSEQTNSTVNDSPEAKTMSWEFSTTPVNVTGYQSTSYVCIDSTKVDAQKLKALEAILYGDESTEPRLPMPDEVIATLKGN
jgi:hypothetical protein